MTFVERDGVHLHYETVGEGPPVVLLHGAAGDRTMWRYAGYIDGLNRFRCVLVDSRGHSLSSKPQEIETAYRLEEYVADVRAVIGELGAPWVALWGYSDGAHVAAAVAASIPDRVAALITTGWIADTGTPEEKAAMIELLESSGMDGLNAALERGEGISLPQWMRVHFLATDPEVFIAEIKGFGTGEQVRPSLSSIVAPALLVVGTAEDPDEEVAKVAALLPSGRALTLPGVGHIGVFLASGCSRTRSGCWAKVSPRALHPAHGAGRIVGPLE
jgi:pimeloyl-ACP methyl ester carboxylesterase